MQSKWWTLQRKISARHSPNISTLSFKSGALFQIQHFSTSLELDELLNIKETIKAIEQLKIGKAAWVTYRHHQPLCTIINIHWTDYICKVIISSWSQSAGYQYWDQAGLGRCPEREIITWPRLLMNGNFSTGQLYRAACDTDHCQWSAFAADQNAWHRITSLIQD